MSSSVRAAPRGWWLMLALAAGIASYGLRFTVVGIEAFGPDLFASFSQRPWAIYAHVTFGPLALIAGALNFRHGMRRAHPVLFREALHGFLPAYNIIAWSCWVPNVIVAEWIARRTTHPA